MLVASMIGHGMQMMVCGPFVNVGWLASMHQGNALARLRVPAAIDAVKKSDPRDTKVFAPVAEQCFSWSTRCKSSDAAGDPVSAGPRRSLRRGPASRVGEVVFTSWCGRGGHLLAGFHGGGGCGCARRCRGRDVEWFWRA